MLTGRTGELPGRTAGMPTPNRRVAEASVVTFWTNVACWPCSCVPAQATNATRPTSERGTHPNLDLVPSPDGRAPTFTGGGDDGASIIGPPRVSEDGTGSPTWVSSAS